MRTALSDDFDADDETSVHTTHSEPDGSDPNGDNTGAASSAAGDDADEYPDAIAWVEQWFAPMIRRRITDHAGSALSWDDRWWLYPEVVGRLISLHEAWEEAYASPKRSAMSSWWIQHLEPHLRVILDSETGPMSRAKPDQSWSGYPGLPTDTHIPGEVRATIIRDGHKPRLSKPAKRPTTT